MISATAVPQQRSSMELAHLLLQYDEGNRSPALINRIDREAGQIGAATSRLFWYTDLDAAKKAARDEHKPLLSLRLLGRLDEELSCANSRFFRKMLYSDPTIARLLRERFVLHWESLRPVPLLTIDFGDGRSIKRTITGNSIHYLVLPDGRLADALPGMIDANTFEREIKAFAALAEKPSITDQDLAAYREATLKRLAQLPVVPAPARGADVAGRLAVSKTVVERAPLLATRNPSQFVLADTRLNETTFRPQIIRWIAAGQVDLHQLNDRIYAELFLAPLNDPLMGLGLPDEAAMFGTPAAGQPTLSISIQAPSATPIAQVPPRP